MRKPRLTALGVIYRQRDDQREFLVQCADNEAFYRFPGGSIEFGETAAETIVRELLEEYELEVTVGALWIVNENFFAYRAKSGHTVNLLHLCHLTSETAFRELRHKEYDDIKLAWRCQSHFQHRPLYPQGIQAYLHAEMEQIVHLVSYQTTK
jgi:8-oxo-dGTP pyrophosphatase MutT (NUDIX family)